VKGQTRPVQEIFVIDNASDDGTPSWLAEQSGLTVIRQENLGSSGGQYAGVKAAYQAGHNWFWLMDDDTLPTPTALERMAGCPYFREATTGFLASLVTWTDGKPHCMNTHEPAKADRWVHTVLSDHCMRVLTSSFVSMMVSRPAVAKVGLPIQDMFIWFDDVEFTARIAGHFLNYVVLDSIAVHKTVANKAPLVHPIQPGDYTKYCYGLRNQIMYIRRQPVSFITRAKRLAWVCVRNLKVILKNPRATPHAGLDDQRVFLYAKNRSRLSAHSRLGDNIPPFGG